MNSRNLLPVVALVASLLATQAFGFGESNDEVKAVEAAPSYAPGEHKKIGLLGLSARLEARKAARTSRIEQNSPKPAEHLYTRDVSGVELPSRQDHKNAEFYEGIDSICGKGVLAKEDRDYLAKAIFSAAQSHVRTALWFSGFINRTIQETGKVNQEGRLGITNVCLSFCEQGQFGSLQDSYRGFLTPALTCEDVGNIYTRLAELMKAKKVPDFIGHCFKKLLSPAMSGEDVLRLLDKVASIYNSYSLDGANGVQGYLIDTVAPLWKTKAGIDDRLAYMDAFIDASLDTEMVNVGEDRRVVLDGGRLACYNEAFKEFFTVRGGVTEDHKPKFPSLTLTVEETQRALGIFQQYYGNKNKISGQLWRAADAMNEVQVGSDGALPVGCLDTIEAILTGKEDGIEGDVYKKHTWAHLR